MSTTLPASMPVLHYGDMHLEPRDEDRVPVYTGYTPTSPMWDPSRPYKSPETKKRKADDDVTPPGTKQRKARTQCDGENDECKGPRGCVHGWAYTKFPKPNPISQDKLKPDWRNNMPEYMFVQSIGDGQVTVATAPQCIGWYSSFISFFPTSDVLAVGDVWPHHVVTGNNVKKL